MSEVEQDMTVRKEQVELKLQQRNQLREIQLEASRTARSTSGQESTEDRVVQFYKEMDPLVEELKTLMNQASLLPAEEVTTNLDLMVVKHQKLQEFVTDSGLFLPTYDVKKCQGIMNNLSTQFQMVQETVKPKKKFGFKNRKHKTAKKAETVPDIGSLSVVDCGGDDGIGNYSSSNYCSLSNLTDQTIILTRDQVEAKDVSLEHMNRCRVEIQGPASTLHISNIINCTILSGPVSTSVMVDGCTSSTLSISCQQMRTHRTYNTDIYLHTTARAILEDCDNVRVAPYTWDYLGMDGDFVKAGLDKGINHWKEVGDFNWLALDRPSPHWSLLPEGERRTDWGNSQV